MQFTALLHRDEKTDKDANADQKTEPSGKILDNQIIRGVMNESLKAFGVCVLGTKTIKPKPGYVPPACLHCQMYIDKEDARRKDEPHYRLCIKNASPSQAVLLNEIVDCYRKLCSKVCGKTNRIVFSDFILKVLEQLKQERPDSTPPDQTTLCRVCYEVANALKKQHHKKNPEDIIFGKAKFSRDPNFVPYEFLQEVRTCVYIGLIDAGRDLVDRDLSFKPFRRTYRLSLWGQRYFIALESHKRSGSKEYKGYLPVLGDVEAVFAANRGKGVPRHYRSARRRIDEILRKWDEECHEYHGRHEKALRDIEKKLRNGRIATAR